MAVVRLMPSSKLVPVLAIAFMLSTLLIAFGIMRTREYPVEAPTHTDFGPHNFDPLWDAPDFSMRDQRGAVVSRSSLAGSVWIANFIFTECRTICPLLTSKMVYLQRQLAEVPVRFVSFSVDPEHDTPEVLRAYAERWAPNEARWSLLATEAATLPALAEAFHILAKKSEDPNDPIIHSSAFVLVDGAGRVRGMFDSEHAEDLSELMRGARLLTGVGGAIRGKPLPEEPEELYHALSCANCHERAELAPPITGLAGARRELDNGLSVLADDDYARDSLRAPDKHRLRGYPLRMPSYDGILDEPRLARLATWVLQRQVASPDPTGATQVVEDPVCHMQVRVLPDTPTATLDGKTHYFCSRLCRDELVARPQLYRK